MADGDVLAHAHHSVLAAVAHVLARRRPIAPDVGRVDDHTVGAIDHHATRERLAMYQRGEAAREGIGRDEHVSGLWVTFNSSPDADAEWLATDARGHVVLRDQHVIAKTDGDHARAAAASRTVAHVRGDGVVVDGQPNVAVRDYATTLCARPCWKG